MIEDGNGGSGIVVVRYQIAELAATAKATGGAISFYNGKTIHTFVGSGTFTASEPFNVEYVAMIGGGGGGAGHNAGGGGGGGGMVFSSIQTVEYPSTNAFIVCWCWW